MDPRIDSNRKATPAQGETTPVSPARLPTESTETQRQVQGVPDLIKPQEVEPKKPISATIAPGWGTRMVNWAGKKVFGEYDKDQLSIKDRREKLEEIVGHKDLNEFARSLAVTSANQIEIASKGKKIGGLIEYEKPVLIDLIEVNILNAFINLAAKVKEQKPNVILGKDELFAEIMNLAAKGTHTQINQIYKELADIEVAAHDELKKNIEEFDLDPAQAEERKAAIFTAAKNRKMQKIAPIAEEIMKAAFPHGSSDIVNPNKKGWVDLTGVLTGMVYWNIEKFMLPNLVLDVSEKFMAVGKAHEQNKAKIAKYKDGPQLLELGKALAGQFDKLIKYVMRENKQTIERQIGGLHENVGKAVGDAAERLAIAKGSDFEKLLNILGNFGEQIAMHVLAKAGEGLDDTEKRRILTVIVEKVLKDVFDFVEMKANLLEPAYAKYQKELEDINKKYPADAVDPDIKARRRQAIEQAEKPLKDLMKPLANTILTHLGIDETGLAQILPDKFSGFNAWIISWFVNEDFLPHYLSGLLQDFTADFAFQCYRDVIVAQRKEPEGKERLAGYAEGVKTLDAIITEMMPTINLAVSDSGSDIGKIVLESINDLFEFQADAKFLEAPIQELVQSPLMPKIDAFGQGYIKNALVDLLSNLALRNPDFQKSAKIEMLPAAVLHVLKIGDKTIKNPAELIEKMRTWKKDLAACEKMPENTEDEKMAKKAALKESDKQKAELRKAFKPCTDEILKQGGWDDPKNIPAPELLKSKVKEVVSEVALSEVLFRIYSDTFVLNQLTEQETALLSKPERVAQVSEGVAKKSVKPIKDSIEEYGFLIASKMNQKVAGSQLSAHDEAILGSNIGQIVQAKNPTTQRMWGGVQKLFGDLMSQFINRLSLSYTGEDQGDDLSNALEKLKQIVSEQKMDEQLVSDIRDYQGRTKEIKDLDDRIGKMQAEAIKIVPTVDDNLLKTVKVEKTYAVYNEELKGIETELAAAQTGGSDLVYAAHELVAAASKKIAGLEERKKTCQAQAYGALLKEIDQLKAERRTKFFALHETAMKEESKDLHAKLDAAHREVSSTMPYVSDELAQRVANLENQISSKNAELAKHDKQFGLLMDIHNLEGWIAQIKNEPNKKPLMEQVAQYRGMLIHEIGAMKDEIEQLKAAQSHESDIEKKEKLKSRIGDLQKRVHVSELNMANDDLLKLANEIKAAEEGVLMLMREASMVTPIFEDSARETRARLNTDLLIGALERHCEDKRLQLEQTPPLQAKYEKLLDQFRPLTKQLFTEIGFRGPKDLPVPFFMQNILWETLREGVVPDALLEMYRAAWVPSPEAIETRQKLEEVGAGKLKPQLEYVETAINVATDKGLEKAKEIMADENSPLPKLLADVLTKQGINGLDQTWFKQWMQKLSLDQGPTNKAIWKMANEFLQLRLEYIATHMATAGGRTGDNLLKFIFTQMFDTIDAHFQKNKAAIDAAIRHYNAIPAGPLQEEYKQKASKELFADLTKDILKSMGLDKPNSTGIAFVHGTLMATIEDTIQGLCFDIYHDVRSPQAALPAIKEKLAEQIAQEKSMQPDEVAKLRDQISNTFGAFGEMIRDAVKKQIGTMPSVNEIVGIKDGKIVATGRTEENWKKAVSGQWVLLESRTKPGQFNIVQKQRGKERKECPRIPLPPGPINEEAISKSLADLQRKTLAKNIAMQAHEKLGGSKGPVTSEMVDWIAQGIEGIVNSDQVDKAIGNIPEMVEAVVLKKLMQWAQSGDMPIKPEKGESPLKYMPANIVITVLNGIDGHRDQLKGAMKKAVEENPDITDAELQEILKGETLKIVEELSAKLKVNPKEDLPMPYAQEIWDSVGKSAMADMFAKTYVDMTRVYRAKKLHKAALDLRYADRKEQGHKHAGPTEAVKEYTNFAMKYLKNMFVVNTPGVEGGVNAVIDMLKGQGKGSKGEAAGFYVEANREVLRKWITESNLKKIGESAEAGVQGVLWPAAQKEIQSVMLKIFDNFTGNIAALEKQDPERTFNFAIDVMGMMAEHLEAVNGVTKEEGKTYMHEVDPVVMEKRYSEKGVLHPDMPGYLLRMNIRQAEQLVIQAAKELAAIKENSEATKESLNAAEDKLIAARNGLEILQNEAETKLKEGTYQKLTPYVLGLAGYNKPEDLEEIPAEHRDMVWKALNESLGPEIFRVVFDEVFKPEMMNKYMLSLLEVVNDKIGKALVEEASTIPSFYVNMKHSRNEVIGAARELASLRSGPQTEESPKQLKAAEDRLQDARNHYEALIGKVDIKQEAYKTYVATSLHDAGFNSPVDLPVPASEQQALWNKLSLKVDFPETMPKKHAAEIPIGTEEELKERQAKCQRLIHALGKALPGTVLGGLANLKLVGKLAAPVVEEIVRDSMKDWTMQNIIGEAIVSGAKSLPKDELPATEEEIARAADKGKVDAKKTEKEIQKQTAKAVAAVRNSIWVWCNLKWKGVQKAVDGWIKKNDVNGIFTSFKAGLDKVFRKVFFDIVGTAVVFILRQPFDFFWKIYEKNRIKKEAEHARQNVLQPIHANVPLKGADLLMKRFPKGDIRHRG